MAAAAPLSTDALNYCANCLVYDWPQPQDLAALKRCSRCKELAYCGKLCQREHWEKVHKEHCRYLAKPNTAPASLHTADCNPCREEAAVGGTITEPTNPTYPCIDRGVEDLPAGLGSPNPFPLAGLPGDRQERTVLALMKILAKIVYTKHPVFIAHKEEIYKMMHTLKGLRQDLWIGRKIWPESHNMGGVNVKDVIELQRRIQWNQAKYDARDKFRLLSLFQLVLTFLPGSHLMQRQLRLRSPLATVAEEHHHLLHRAGEGGHLEMVDKVLHMIGNKLVPYTEVMKIIGGGSLKKKCSFCGHSLTVREVMTGQINELVPQVLIHPTAVGLVSCNRHSCALELDARLNDDYVWSITVQSSSTSAHQCDHCFQLVPIQAIHRCSTCLTKQYCSLACIMQDATAGHTVGKFCKKEERKVKGGRRDRVKTGKKAVKRALDNTVEAHRAAGAPEGLVAIMESFKL